MSAKKTEIEIRRDENGEIDEILLWQQDKCLFHVERLDTTAFWMGLYDDERDNYFNFFSKSKIELH